MLQSKVGVLTKAMPASATLTYMSKCGRQCDFPGKHSDIEGSMQSTMQTNPFKVSKKFHVDYARASRRVGVHMR